MILSQQPISALSFIEDNVLAAGSNSVKSVSLWVGIDNIGSTRLETGWLCFIWWSTLAASATVKFNTVAIWKAPEPCLAPSSGVILQNAEQRW